MASNNPRPPNGGIIPERRVNTHKKRARESHREAQSPDSMLADSRGKKARHEEDVERRERSNSLNLSHRGDWPGRQGAMGSQAKKPTPEVGVKKAGRNARARPSRDDSSESDILVSPKQKKAGSNTRARSSSGDSSESEQSVDPRWSAADDLKLRQTRAKEELLVWHLCRTMYDIDLPDLIPAHLLRNGVWNGLSKGTLDALYVLIRLAPFTITIEDLGKDGKGKPLKRGGQTDTEKQRLKTKKGDALLRLRWALSKMVSLRRSALEEEEDENHPVHTPEDIVLTEVVIQISDVERLLVQDDLQPTQSLRDLLEPFRTQTTRGYGFLTKNLVFESKGTVPNEYYLTQLDIRNIIACWDIWLIKKANANVFRNGIHSTGGLLPLPYLPGEQADIHEEALEYKKEYIIRQRDTGDVAEDSESESEAEPEINLEFEEQTGEALAATETTTSRRSKRLKKPREVEDEVEDEVEEEDEVVVSTLTRKSGRPRKHSPGHIRPKSFGPKGYQTRGRPKGAKNKSSFVADSAKFIIDDDEVVSSEVPEVDQSAQPRSRGRSLASKPAIYPSAEISEMTETDDTALDQSSQPKGRGRRSSSHFSADGNMADSIEVDEDMSYDNPSDPDQDLQNSAALATQASEAHQAAEKAKERAAVIAKTKELEAAAKAVGQGRPWKSNPEALRKIQASTEAQMKEKLESENQ